MTASRRPVHPRLAEIVVYLEETRADLVAAAHAVPADGWADRPTAAGWSPAEIVDHLRIVEHGVVRLLQKLVGEARAAGHPAETEGDSIIDAAFVASLADRSNRREAPARVMPTRSVDMATGLAAMAAERGELMAAMADADGLALGSLTWTHPSLGTLNLYEWLVFVGAHETRHAGQLREIAVAFAPRD